MLIPHLEAKLCPSGGRSVVPIMFVWIFSVQGICFGIKVLHADLYSIQVPILLIPCHTWLKTEQ